MSPLVRILVIVAGVVGIGALAYAVIRCIIRDLFDLSGTTASLTIIAVITSLLVGRILTSGHVRAEQIRARSLQYTERSEAYESLLGHWIIILSSKGRSNQDLERQKVAIVACERRLVLIGGARVIQQYLQFRQQFVEGGLDAMTEFGSLLAAMRKDLGRSTFAFETQKLLHLIQVQSPEA